MTKYVNAVIGDEPVDGSLPVLEGRLGPQAVDIQSLYARHGLLAYDPGYRSTASCKSGITFVDGDAGVLAYRGYPIEQLAEKSHFLEVAYLLMFGELPSAAEEATFRDSVCQHNLLPLNV